MLDRFATSRKAGKAGKEKDLATDIIEKLRNISIAIVGDNTAANQRVAALLAGELEYVPLDTKSIVEQLLKCSVEELVAQEGITSLALVEAAALESLSTNIRCCIATCGGGGAAARGDCWRHLFGTVTVWLDDHTEASQDAAPQREAYAQAEVHVKVDTAGRQADDDSVVDEIARDASAGTTSWWSLSVHFTKDA
ncbi:hypothetical protein WJX72_007827 [[Myrmecia] bisecta]|uniref:Uncharacterized protein n=1 Tax=[Myrmecia] bisecta TaxID=41462 RepID=A0AAW1QFQ8_9CHLO